MHAMTRGLLVRSTSAIKSCLCGRRWEPNSYGYHGDDGKKFHASGQGEVYANKMFSTGDVVGAGVHLERKEIFFTCAPSPCCPTLHCSMRLHVLCFSRACFVLPSQNAAPLCAAP